MELSERVAPPSAAVGCSAGPFGGVPPSDFEHLKFEFPSICNSNGKPRLEIARKKLLELVEDGVDNHQLSEFIINSYQMWVNFHEFMVFWNEVENKTLIVKCRKRGNDVYESWFRKRYFKLLRGFAKEVKFFDFGKKERVVKSPLIFFTLTFKHDNFMDIGKNVGKYLNQFMARIRKRIPHVYLITRVWQCHKDGWIHIHGLLLLDTWVHSEKEWFSGFRHVSKKNGKVTYRLSKHLWKWFKAQWVYGFSDFQLCDSLMGGLKYISRYLFHKSDEDNSHDVEVKMLTYAVCWIFRLRSFSFNYRKIYLLYANTQTLLRLDTVKHNSNWVLVGFVDYRSSVIPVNGYFELIDGYPSFLT
jgi:hypothetical protein